MPNNATKDAKIYYPHSANARNEDNMIRLRMTHGPAGYGVYHMLLERLRLSEGYICELDYDILSWDLDCSKDLIRSVIYDFGLFEIINDGQMFSSVDLDAYMRTMEQKAAERKAKAQAAANARWDNNVASPEVGKKQPELPLDKEPYKAQDTDRLDKEVEAIKADIQWQEEMAKESGKTKEEIVGYLEDFRTVCILRGIKGGHKDMTDALSHFRSWIYKSGKAEDPNCRNGISGGCRGKGSGILATEIHNRLDKQSAERNDAYQKNEESKADIRLYIMNKGYDPAEVTMVQLAQPDWTENNPPTHPEWIGCFIKPIEVPF